MSDTKALNNRLDNSARRITELEQELARLTDQAAAVTAADVIQQLTAEKRTVEQQVRIYKGKYEACVSERNYFRTELRRLAADSNTLNGLPETLARRVESLQHGAMPGDRIATAAVIECRAVLAIVRDIVGRTA